MTRPHPRVEISVVTPTHNRPASLLRLLRALRDGSFPAGQFEVVVVADGCSDDTVTLARAEPLPFPVRVLEQTPGRGAAAARNLGASHATGDLLVFLDDDIEPGAALLAEHSRAHAAVGVPAVVIGPPLPVRPPGADLGTIAAWVWWEGQFARMRRPGHRFSYDEVFSGNLSMPAALFQAVGGFDVEFNNCRDDSELGLRLINAGARVLFVPAAGGWHHELRDHDRLIRRKRAEGRADVRLARLHPELWPALRISWPLMPLWDPLGVLRRAALTAPRLAAVLIWGLTRALPILQRLRLRGTWRKVQAGVMYGWYWRGIADAVGDRRGLVALESDCKARVPAPDPPLDIDLAEGLEEAESRIEIAKPLAVRIRFGALEVGSIPPQPGAEPLRAEHLRVALRTELSHALIAVMSTLAAAGHHRVPTPGVLRLARSSTGPVPVSPPVSVIIAAHNAGTTLAETLGSLQRQTHAGWEAIVVDDGSTDDTAAVVARYAALDSRIRLLRQQQQGPGPARNTGLALASHPWLMFLDADDWLLPHALEQLSARATALGTVDAVHGGWARVTADGATTATELAPPESDLFARFAEYCAFPIHCCLFRRELATRIGGFDPSLRTCEDWDFWQRLARSGARFARLTEKVAHYRMQLRSGATATEHLLPEGLAVIERGHARDPRVQFPVHADGAPRSELPAARLRFASWVAGLLLGREGSAAGVLGSIAGESAPDLRPVDVATNLFRTVPLSLARGVESWDDLWPRVADGLTAFLTALERQSGSPRLADLSMMSLEQLTLGSSREGRPFVRGTTRAIAVEVTRPMETITLAAAVQWIHCNVLANGERIGELVMRASDGAVAAQALSDAIVAEFAWPILGRHFAATSYAELEFLRGPLGLSVCLASVPLTPPVPDTIVVSPDGLHDLIGWTLLLQEVGEAAGPPSAGVIPPSWLKSVLTTETGFELCRVVVREAVLGQPFQGERLGARLSARAELAGIHAAEGSSPPRVGG